MTTVAPTFSEKVFQGTLSAFRSADFRLYFIGQLVSVSGTWMQNLAQGYLVFSITGSELWLGIVACAAGLPILLLSPISGVIVERVPRRRLMICTQTAQMLLAFILAALTFTNTVQVWHIVTLAFLLGMTNALDLPARQAFVFEMVGPEDLRSGIALNSILNSASRIFGPAAAGIALAQFGPAWCFLLNGLSFLAVIASLIVMNVPHAISPRHVTAPLEQLREGLRYAVDDPLIKPLLLLATIGGIFVVPFIQILPAFADVVLHSPQEGYAWLTAGQGAGAVIAGLLVGWLATRFRYGRVMAASMILGAVSTFVFALQVTIPLAVVFSFATGVFLILQFVSINTMIQSVVARDYRGRILALYTLSFLGTAPFGALFLGGIANVLGTPAALVIFAIAGGLLGGLILWRWPKVLALGLTRRD